jgi:hypothetical protein
MHVGGCRRLICIKGDVGTHVETTIPIQVSPLKGNTIQHGRDREIGVMKRLGGLVRTCSVYRFPPALMLCECRVRIS